MPCFFANKCRRVRLAKRRDRRGRPRTCCLEYPPVQVDLSRAFPLAATLPTMSTTPASRKMGDEITLLVSKVFTIRASFPVTTSPYTAIAFSNLISSLISNLPINRISVEPRPSFPVIPCKFQPMQMSYRLRFAALKMYQSRDQESYFRVLREC